MQYILDFLRVGWRLCQEYRWLGGVVFIVGILMILLTNPLPPKRIRIFTYSDFPISETEQLQALGFEIEIVPTQGSLDNAHRLHESEDLAVIALIQGGALSNDEIDGFESLGSIAYEPVWTFYRKSLGIHPTRLSELRGLKIGVGPNLSGSKVVARKLFAEDGIDIDREPGFLSGKSSVEYADDLEKGLIDVVVEVNPHADPHIKRMLENPGIDLMSYRLAEAYKEKFRFIQSIKLPKGAISIHDEKPPEDIQLIATTLNVVVKQGTHPDLQTLFLVAAQQSSRNPKSLLFDSADRFPRYMDPQIPLSEAAQHFYTFGMPSTLNYFPARLAGLIDRYWVLFVGIVSVGYTLIQILLEMSKHLSRMRQKPLCERLGQIKRMTSRNAKQQLSSIELVHLRDEVQTIYDNLMKDAATFENDAEFILVLSEAEKLMERLDEVH
jgi:TRAP-type uncharacterized transport system substrate-binding protein